MKVQVTTNPGAATATAKSSVQSLSKTMRAPQAPTTTRIANLLDYVAWLVSQSDAVSLLPQPLLARQLSSVAPAGSKMQVHSHPGHPVHRSLYLKPSCASWALFHHYTLTMSCQDAGALTSRTTCILKMPACVLMMPACMLMMPACNLMMTASMLMMPACILMVHSHPGHPVH